VRNLWLFPPMIGLLIPIALAHPQVPPAVSVELTGQSQVWTETHAVYETTEDARFQRERYGADFHVRLHGLPPGRYSLKLGFAEMKFTEPGQRVFSLVANGETLLGNFDILREVANYEALVKVFRIRLDQPVLDLHFIGHVDNAKFCFIRVYDDQFVVEVTPDLAALQPPKPDQPDAPYLAGMFETSIGKFGSRVAFNPRPRSRSWWQGALGNADYAVAYFEKDAKRWQDAPYDMVFGTTSGAAIYALPFTEDVPSFPQVRQSLTPTSLTYVCRAPDLPYEVEFRFVAPFYPQDLKLSTAPYVRVDAAVRDLSGQAPQGRLYVGQGVRAGDTVAPLEATGLVGSTYAVTQFGKQTQQVWATPAGDDVRPLAGELPTSEPVDEEAPNLPRDPDGRLIVPVGQWQPIEGLAWDFKLEPGGSAQRSFVYVGWCGEPVLAMPQRGLGFKYLEFFKTPAEVATYAFAEQPTIDRRTRLFDDTILGVRGMPPEFADLFSLAFQSWVMNTWFMSDAQGDWFSVWEGCCKFHSTVDVEYNTMPFYLQYWPELARLTLDEWASHERGGVMPHDMGMGFDVGPMQYPHQMEVEEGTNYVLLLMAYWRATGDADTPKRHLALAGRLMDYVAQCDTDGDGFPERGTANTVDQGSTAIQHGPKQVYLAVKALAAWQALEAMAKAGGDQELAGKQADRTARVTATLRDKAWMKDHYVVALKPAASPGGAPDRYAGGGPGPGESYGGMGGGPGDRGWGWNQGQGYSYAPEAPAGWDGYSIYAANGLLYPLAYGLPVDIDRTRMRNDLLVATAKTLKRFGSPHTDREGNTWISQNLWRDMVAAYLGLDMLGNVSRYWAFELEQNRFRRGCFTDVYNYGSGSTSLDYYPRGIALAGLIPAAAGLQVDRIARTISFAPIRSPLRIPLTAFADWPNEQIPWADITAGEGGPVAHVDSPASLLPIQVEVRTNPASPLPPPPENQ
jgi:hypothetical protein